jgi:ligand-binding SRPBCC domain-containing protein
MAGIILHTKIKAPSERCFLLSLSVDLHKGSTAHTNERAIAGVTNGLMKLNDMVTWEAKHFGVVQHFTSKVSVYEKPAYFVSEMQKGAFKKFYHQHHFKQEGDNCIMTDELELIAPLGILGKIAMSIAVKKHIEQLLLKRNEFIKKVAEGEDWEKYLTPDTL